MKATVILVPLLLVALGSAAAQSLAELAEKEKERREAIDSTEVESFDDATLAERRRAMPPSTLPTVLPDEASGESGEAEGLVETEELEEEDPTQTQAYWRDRKAGIDRRIAGIRAQLDAPGFDSDPNNLMRRSQLEQQLEQALSDLAALQAEARSQGVPPGWVR